MMRLSMVVHGGSNYYFKLSLHSKSITFDVSMPEEDSNPLYSQLHH
jgi:hypothetical protein